MFRAGEPMRVALTVDCRVPAARAVVALEVRDSRGERCFRTNATLGPVEERVEVSFDVERLALLGGDYDLAVGAHDQDVPGAALLDRVARFSVAETLDGEGVADLRGAWTVAGRAAETVSR